MHIPFCESKCNYCSFVSACHSKEIQAEYFSCLKKEIIFHSQAVNNPKSNMVCSSVYFGGGTPSSVQEDFIISTLETIKSKFNFIDDAEISIECNPNSATFEKLKAYHMAGINRVSFGVQSFSEKTLKLLGRKHTTADAFNAIKNAKKAGINNISIDLILGAEKLDYQEFERDIIQMKNIGVTHVSAYMLILEKGTPLYNSFQNGDYTPPTDDEVVDDYEKVVEILKKQNYFRYEISNFALSGYECRHNKNYWLCGEYLGFGISAHSHFNNSRFENTEEISDYINKLKSATGSIGDIKKMPQVSKIQYLSSKEKVKEYIMLSLRTSEGLNFEHLKKLGYDLQNQKAKEITLLKEKNIIELVSNQDSTLKVLKIAPTHFGVLNQIILKLMP